MTRPEAIEKALENLLIGIGMGWDLDGMVNVAQAALALPEDIKVVNSDDLIQEKTMQDFQLRVIEEKAALDTKLSALGKFLDKNGNNPQISRDEWSRLSTQMHLMCSYSAILGARIAAFEL